MMEKLRGRSLAHPGCLVGITVGLTVGIIIAGVLAQVFNVALNILLIIWLVFTLGLGAVGWVIGERLSSRFPAREEEATSGEKVEAVASENPPPDE